MSNTTTRTWFIMDGRARFDMDRAAVLITVDDLQEGKDNLEDFGDAVVVSYGSDGQYLIDGRIEFDPQSKGGDCLRQANKKSK